MISRCVICIRTNRRFTVFTVQRNIDHTQRTCVYLVRMGINENIEHKTVHVCMEMHDIYGIRKWFVDARTYGIISESK